jgi:hypothetical protein
MVLFLRIEITDNRSAAKLMLSALQKQQTRRLPGLSFARNGAAD